MLIRNLLLGLILLQISGCMATPRFSDRGVDVEPEPQEVVQRPIVAVPPPPPATPTPLLSKNQIQIITESSCTPQPTKSTKPPVKKKSAPKKKVVC